MRISTRIIKLTNRIFPPVVHPFNLQNDGKKTYAEWQFEKGGDTVACFRPKYHPDDMFVGKTILDMGCGAGGKSLYYASLGATRVVGVDIVEHYEAEANALARKLGYADRFSFICASADDLPFPDGTFDTIIMNDFMEHVGDPEAALKEARRLIKDDGRIFINFPPYYHPTGAHLSDTIHMPWVHMFFTESQLVAAYRHLVRGLPDEKERLSLRLSTRPDGTEYFGYINHMTLRRFKSITKSLDITPIYYNEIPLRKYFSIFAKLPGIKEMFVKMAVVVIGK